MGAKVPISILQGDFLWKSNRVKPSPRRGASFFTRFPFPITARTKARSAGGPRGARLQQVAEAAWPAVPVHQAAVELRLRDGAQEVLRRRTAAAE